MQTRRFLLCAFFFVYFIISGSAVLEALLFGGVRPGETLLYLLVCSVSFFMVIWLTPDKAIPDEGE